MLLDIIIISVVVYLSLVLVVLYIFWKSGIKGKLLLLAVVFPIFHVLVVGYLSYKAIITGKFKLSFTILFYPMPRLALVVKEILMEKIAFYASSNILQNENKYQYAGTKIIQEVHYNNVFKPIKFLASTMKSIKSDDFGLKIS